MNNGKVPQVTLEIVAGILELFCEICCDELIVARLKM
jgi:hypothetical protein